MKGAFDISVSFTSFVAPSLLHFGQLSLTNTPSVMRTNLGPCFVFLCITVLLADCHQHSSECNHPHSTISVDGETGDCFCSSSVDVVSCECDELSLDTFNKQTVNPLTQKIMRHVFFRYFKVNLERDCPFWEENDRCSIRDCAVKTCTREELPASLRNLPSAKIQSEGQIQKACAMEEELSSVDTSLTGEQKVDVANWEGLNDDNFCVMDDEDSSDCSYIDLSKNPERYTGYSGPPANRIWRAIYEENCFKPSEEFSAYSLARAMQLETCVEKKAFYRLISGLHSSISMHLCAEYLHPYGQWGPNYQEFFRRFDDSVTDNEGSSRVTNLYFTYSVVLRAILKASPRFFAESFFTGDPVDDELIRKEVRLFLHSISHYSLQFNEQKLFCGDNTHKEQFRQHFRNISRIMDCVGCEKCRLWGKVQTQGIGTALKILFTDTASIEDLSLKRSEIVSLWNTLGRLSSSLVHLEMFKKMKSDPSIARPFPKPNVIPFAPSPVSSNRFEL